MPLPNSLRWLRLSLVLFVVALPALAQLTSDQQAEMLLASARRAYNEKNFPFAIARFREFLAKFGGNRDLPQARYGLALCLLEGPERNPDQAIEQLNQLAGAKTLAEYPFVLYYTGLARRSLGVKALENARIKPAEAGNWNNVSRQQFEEAAKSFALAATAFADRAKDAKGDKGLPVDLEWSIRSRCDQAEMLLRVRKPKEAREAVAGLTTDKRWQESRYLNLAHYYAGFAAFLLDDAPAAGRSLSRKAVVEDDVVGTHARYLVARLHHLNTRQNEREDARMQYQAVLKDHEDARKTAQERLRQPEQFRTDPEGRARLETLVKGPAPDHIARAGFFLGTLQYEDGRFNEALEHFKTFLTTSPDSPLVPEARLRLGFCQVQMKQNDEAIKTLQPLVDKEPALSDQALYWIARAELNKADPKKPESFKAALDTFRKAADRANQRASANPPDLRARERRGEILADLASAMQQAKQYREAVAVYASIVQEKLLPAREDELLLDQATASQLAGDYAESDKTCTRFLEKHKASTLAPAVLFRQAENSAFLALAAEKIPNQPDRLREMTKFNDQAIQRYTVLVEKYPEYAHIQLARQGLGMAYYRKGDLDKSQKTLEAIPVGERSGDLATVSYNLADIYLRQAPARADDAVAAGRLEEKLKGAAEQLEGFLGAAPESAQAPDALLKLGYCQQRMAKLLAQPPDQQKMLAAARATYERLLQKYPRDVSAAQGTFERAKVLALQNDVNGAMNELRKFSADPLKKSTIAPMALLHLATLQRGQNRPAEAVATLAECRKSHEEALRNDKARSNWLLLVQYHHAAALREAGKLAEARELFDQVARASADRQESWDAYLRAGQSQKEFAEKKIAEGRKQATNMGLKPEQRQAGEKLLGEGVQDLRNAVAYLAASEQSLRTRKAASEEGQKALAQIRGRLMYETAWGWRTLAEMEVESARQKLALDRWQKRRDEIARITPAGQAPPTIAIPEVALAEVPLQPGETSLRNSYRELIKAFPELVLNADARFELAEILSGRNEHDEAAKLLQGALEGDREPAPELLDRIKVRLATCLLDRGSRKLLDARTKLAQPKLDPKDKALADKGLEEGKKDIDSALEQLQPVTGNPKSAMLAQGTYREAECHLLLGKTDEAIKLLVKFRDHGPFQNVPGLSDRALLRLGAALAQAKQWEPSRQAYETLVGRFGGSPWVHEARYGIAWAWQNQGQYDNAVNTYQQVTSALATELAARAQLNIGLCRQMQKRHAEASTALLVVPFTYDYPELNALALVEAARALSDNKQPDQAVKLLQRVLRDHAGSAQADAARKRLAELGEG